jgi:hypothetical protein
MITPEIYADFVIQLAHKDGVRMPLACICLGLAGETGELEEALLTGTLQEALLEAGDVLWYHTALVWALTCEGVAVEARGEPNNLPLSTNVARICDHVKKALWHGKDLDSELLSGLLLSSAMRLQDVTGKDLMQIAQANYEKLSARYPNAKFVEGGGIR